MIDRTESHLIAQERRNRGMSNVVPTAPAHASEGVPERGPERVARKARAADPAAAAHTAAPVRKPGRTRRK